MDQSQDGHHLGAFDHDQFAVEYGFDGTDEQTFHGDNIDVVDPAYYAVDDHASSVNTQGLNSFQQPATPYSFYTSQFGQQQAAGSQQQGMGTFSFADPSHPLAQSNSHVANVANAYHDQRVHSPAVGSQLNDYQPLAAQQPHTGYQAAQAHNGYLASQPQANFVHNSSHNGHLSGSTAPQLSFQQYRHVSSSPQPYRPIPSPYGHQAGQGLGAQPAMNAQQIPGTPPIHQSQVVAQTQPASQSQPATQSQPVFQPPPIPQPQPASQPQAVTQPQSAPANLAAQSAPVQAQVAQAPPTVPLSDPYVMGVPTPAPGSNTWEGGTRNFNLGSRAVQAAKQKYQQTVSLFASSNKQRVFPQRTFYLPNEALGKFMDGIEAMQPLPDAQKDIKRKELYCILKYDLRRPEKPMDPAELAKVIEKEAKHRKLLKYGKPSEDIRESEQRAEVGCEVAALLDIHTLWGANDALIKRIAEDLEAFLTKHVELLRGKAEYKQLAAAVKRRREDPTSVPQLTIRRLKDVVGPAREKVGRLLTVASVKAKDRVLAKLALDSEDQPAVLVPVWNLALVCANTGDSTSPLVKAVLDFSARFPSLDDKFLGRVKFEQLAVKFEAQGGQEIKAATAKIRAIAAKNPSSKPSSTAGETSQPTSKNKPASSSKPSSKSSATKEMASDSDSVSASKPAGASSKKRPLEEGSESSASKKPATGLTRSDQRPGQPAEKPVLQLQAASRRTPSILPGRRPTTKPASDQSKTRVGSSNPSMPAEPPKARVTTANPPTSSSTETSKPRVGASTPTSTSSDTVQPRASGFNPSMPSELAKLRVSAAAPAPAVSRAETTQQSRSSSSAFSALLAEINEPKQVTRPARTPETVPDLKETEQERERRLRKEKRRKLNLKVAFKADAQLTEIRIFHKEEGEDEGLESNMIRDAADDKAEGKMLKASRRDQITLGREWEEPTMIDFSDIPEEQRRKTFITRGGLITFQTEEQKIMAKEEMTQLMVVYTDHGDIPPTPMSPRSVQPASNAAQAPELPLPVSLKWRNRPAERYFYGPLEQLNKTWNRKIGVEPAEIVRPSVALSIIEEVKKMPPSQLDEPARAEVIFQILSSAKAKTWTDPEPYNPAAPKTAHRTDYPDPQVQAAEDFMQGIVYQFQGQPAIPQEPPVWMTDPKRREEWWKGFYADQAKKDHERHMQEVARQHAEQQAALFAQAQALAPPQQNNPFAPYYQAPNPYQAAPQQSYAQPGLDPQVQALLASLGQQQAPQQAPPAMDPAALLQFAQQFAAQGQQAQPAQYSSGYGQDNSYDQENRRDGGEREGRGRGRGRREDVPDHLKGINRSLIGTKKCVFWAKGQCAKGDKCTFRHE